MKVDRSGESVEASRTGLPRVAIVGGGYAGVMTAIRLAGRVGRGSAAITLINPREQFVERIRLQEVSVGMEAAPVSIAELLEGTGVSFLLGKVQAVDSARKSLSVATERGEVSLSYDVLVLATGSAIEVESVPGVQENAYRPEWESPRGARALARLLQSRQGDRLRVGVVGGGASGVELAGMIAAAFPRNEVHLYAGERIGGFKTAKVESIIRQQLTDFRVALHDEWRVDRVEKDGLVCAGAERSPCDVSVWCGGLIANSGSPRLATQQNTRGQWVTDGYLRLTSDHSIYAVGDCGSPGVCVGAPMRMSVFTAMVTGAHCADTIARQLKGRSLRPLSFSYYGQGIALGGRSAVSFATIPNDEPIGPIYRGVAAYRVRGFFVWYLLKALRIEKRLCGSFYWLGNRRSLQS